MTRISEEQLAALKGEVQQLLVADFSSAASGTQEAITRFAEKLVDAAAEAVILDDQVLLAEVAHIPTLLAKSYEVTLSRQAQETARKTLSIAVRFLVSLLAPTGGVA